MQARRLCRTKTISVTCPHCGAVYQRTTVEMPWHDQGLEDCQICGHLLQRWRGNYIRQFRLLKRGRGVPGDWKRDGSASAEMQLPAVSPDRRPA